MPGENADNVTVVRRYLDLVARGHLESLPDVVDTEAYREICVGVTPGWVGFEASTQSVRPILEAFPDQQLTIDEIVAHEDRVFDRISIRATNRGPLFGIPASQRQVEWQACDFFRLAGGLIVERWFMADLLSVMRQIGGLGG